MADPEHDQEVSRRYRELGRDEPPPELDAKIRAAALGAAATDSRRAPVTHPAPLVVPTGRRRWYFPVAAAAVIVLAVAVTSQVEREQGDDAAVLSQNAPAAEAKPREGFAKPKETRKQEGAGPQEQPRKVAPLAKRTEKPAAAGDAEKPNVPPALAREPAAAAPQAQAPKPVDETKIQESVAGTLPQSREDAFGGRENRSRQERPSSGVASAPVPQRPMQGDQIQQRDEAQPQARAKLAEEPPEKWLERVARLRQEGKHDEADKALAEFRKRHPDYKIPEAMLERVEKR
jgi:hypothetical protein